MTISPFQALRPREEFAEQVASRPYDVLDSQEARTEAAGNNYSFLRITKPEIDLPEGIDVHSQPVYDKGKKNLETFIQNGTLFREPKNCYYIYQLTMDDKSQTGLVCLSSIEDYFNNKIKKHEFTRPEKEKDRIDHMKTLKAQTGNVFMAYRDVMEINALINGWKITAKPVYSFTAPDKVKHDVWVLDRDDIVNSITQLFRTKVPTTYVADGHHRAASAASVSKEFPNLRSAQYFLTTIFPSSQLKILDYNRVISDLNGFSTENLIDRLRKSFKVERSNGRVSPSRPHEFGMYIDGNWYKLNSLPGTYEEDPVGVLDISVLSSNVLDPILGIWDQRTDKRIDFVGGIRGLGELEKRVDEGKWKLAFSLHPVSIEQLFNIADSGNVMPPKSTWFEPKLRDGLVTHVLD